ncbi:MAG TPA: 2-oxo-4-hydroxy-4-carboxy-5-ureidoimidazoline decarboxylase [Candidatus Dormibacteraeota bacterium]
MEADELFEPGSPLAERVRARGGDPVAAAWALLPELADEEKVATLNAHPQIGATRNLSAHSRREQGSEEDPEVMAELQRLNAEYERRFGFRFVVFVNGRPRSVILGVLRSRLERPREVELEEGLRAIVEIAEDRRRQTA